MAGTGWGKKWIALALVGSALLLTAACGAQQPERRTIFAMSTVMDLQAYGPHAKAGLDSAQGEIERLEGLLSVTKETSEVARLNESGGAWQDVSPETGELLDFSLDLGRKTGGALNIALYPIVKEWGFTTGEYQVPQPERLAALLAYTDESLVQYDPAAGRVLVPAGMEIDLGAVAKGYAGDRAAQAMRDQGVTSAILSLGGNIVAVGAKPDGSDWTVAVQDPEDSAKVVCALQVKDQSVVTSGGYERYFAADGKTYWHIIDPATGYPADSGVISATVVGADGALCDGLSTAFFVMGAEKAAEYWQESGDDFDFLLVREDHTLWATQGLEGRFETRDDYAGADVQWVTK